LMIEFDQAGSDSDSEQAGLGFVDFLQADHLAPIYRLRAKEAT
jgi:hypothetical protein